MSSPYINRFLQPDTIIPDLSNPQSWNRYSYVTNRPVNFNDPTGHIEACDKDDWACQHHWDEPITEDPEDTDEYEVKLTKKQKKVVEFLLDSSEFVVSAAVEPIDWILTIDYCAKGECSIWMLAGLLPLIPSSAGKHADDIVDAGYGSFRQLKKVLGDADDGMEWHHIVEQSQIVKSGFPPQQIHNVDNMVAVDKTVHRQISGFYSSNIAGPGSQSVRNWLTGQSFEAQYEFGIQVLKKFGVIP